MKKLTQLEPIDLSKCNKVDDLVTAMSKASFNARQLGEGVDILYEMIKDKDCFKVLTLSGALTPAKLSLVICDIIENKMTDCVVSTGALITHGLVESLGMKHYKCPKEIPDTELKKMRLDRIYDTLETEENLDNFEKILHKILKNVEHSEELCSYKITKLLGEYLSKNIKGRGILKAAYENNVPVIIPAIIDSELALDIGCYNRRRKINNKQQLSFNSFLDLEYYTDMVFNSKKTGLFTVGGGVPRNFAQQVAPYLDILRYRVFNEPETNENSPYIKPFKYAVRICPDSEHWGGLSGSTYKEAQSWGKIDKNARFAEIRSDATIALPIMVKALMERLKIKTKRKPL